MVGGDTLTCGVCRKEFALADIVKFIQHKVLTCNKENYNADTKKTAENGGDANEAEAAASNSPEASTTQTTTTTTTSSLDMSPTSSTLTRRHSISTTTVPEVKSLVGENNNDFVKTELDSTRKQRTCVDAEANTVNSGKLSSKLLVTVRRRQLVAKGHHLIICRHTMGTCFYSRCDLRGCRQAAFC